MAKVHGLFVASFALLMSLTSIFHGIKSIPFVSRGDYVPGSNSRLFKIETLDPSAPIPDEYDEEPIPRNLHIAFLGDSLSRYQYLSLAYFLTHGRWPTNSQRPNMSQEGRGGGHHKSWAGFYNYTKSALAPYEECDCWRVKGELKHHHENRFFYDKSRNNSLSIFMKSGRRAMDIHWKAGDVHKPHELVKELQEEIAYKVKTEWELIETYLPYLDPKPEYVVLNQGSWKFHTLTLDELNQTKAALERNGFVGIYRMNTAGMKKNTDHDNAYCKAMDLCMDSSWTHQFKGEKFMWDQVHWRAHVNRLFNLQLLDAIRDHRGYLY